MPPSRPWKPATDPPPTEAGDFAALLEPMVNTVYTACLRMLGRPEDADDAAQECIARAWAHRDRFDASVPLRPWLLTIAANVCRDRMRTVWWRRVRFFPQPDAGIIVSGDMSYEEAERDLKVRNALLTLPPLYREAMALFHLEEMSYEEMASILGANVPALKQRVRRGREMLGEVLKRRYPELCVERTGEMEDHDP